MQFIHAINLDDWYPCHNLGLNGCLHSPNAVAHNDNGLNQAHRHINNIPIEQLTQGCQLGIVTPRAVGELIRADILRNGQSIINGLNQVEQMSEETRRNAIRCSDVELLFEKIRREEAPNSPSRLSCLFLAERTEAGERMLREMLGKDVYILRVRILQTLSIAKVDSAWFDGFFNTEDNKYPRCYWREQEHPDGAKWEYLFDGVIEVEDHEQIEYIREFGAKP